MPPGLQQKSPNERVAARLTPRASGIRRACPFPSVASTVISRSPPGQSPLAKKKVVTSLPSVAHRAAQGASSSSLRVHRAATDHVSSNSRKLPQELQQGSARMMTNAKQSHAREVDAQLIAALKDKVLKFREILDLPPRTACLTLHELLLGTLKDLEESYILCILVADYDNESPNEVLLQFCKILKYVGNLWNAKCCESEKINLKEVDEEDLSREKLGGIVLDRLDQMSSRLKEMFCLLGKGSSNSTSESEGELAKTNNCSIPLTPTSVLPETLEHNSNVNAFANFTGMPPALQPLSLQAMGKLKAMDMKHLSFHMFPLVLDQNSQPMHQMQSTTDNFRAESVNAVMIVEPVSSANLSNDTFGSGNKDDKSLFTFPGPTSPPELARRQETPTVSVASSPIFVSCMSNPSTANAHQPISSWNMPHPDIDSGEDSKSKSSETAILVAPSLPILRLRASLLSPTPTPPPSPMVLTGVPMFFHSSEYSTMEIEPTTNAGTIDDDVQVDDCKSSETSMCFQPNCSLVSQTSVVPLPANQIPSPVEPSKRPVSPTSPTSSAKCSMEPLSSTPLFTTSAPSLSATSPPPPPPLPRINVSPLSPPTSSPPIAQSLATSPLTPPASPSAKGIAPPPPPQSLAKALRTKKATTKLKRSNQMGSLYRLLKGKVEGSSLPCKASHGQNNQIGSSASGSKAHGMADALAEITKRSTYFRQIEEDVGKYAAAIREVKSALNSFGTKDMVELLSFHRYVEQRLENLTDETQVLARFEDFPSKKLETVRMAASLYRKLDSIVTNLKGWNVMSPIAQQLSKIESFFNKIKEEVDVIERTKDEEAKRFQSHKIEFDFNVLTKIKECMVDLSSNCIEIALKESKDAKEEMVVRACKPIDLSKMLWRAFQLAFRVYNFAGGQDDRADRLATELAHEIETCYQF